MCIINHLKISSRNLVIYHLKMIARHSTPRDFLLKTLYVSPIFFYQLCVLCLGAAQNESHHHFKMSIISVIYHIEKIVIPLEKRIDFEMTLEIIIIIISKRKSYLILSEGQHDGTSPAYT